MNIFKLKLTGHYKLASVSAVSGVSLNNYIGYRISNWKISSLWPQPQGRGSEANFSGNLLNAIIWERRHLGTDAIAVSTRRLRGTTGHHHYFYSYSKNCLLVLLSVWLLCWKCISSYITSKLPHYKHACWQDDIVSAVSSYGNVHRLKIQRNSYPNVVDPLYKPWILNNIRLN